MKMVEMNEYGRTNPDTSSAGGSREIVGAAAREVSLIRQQHVDEVERLRARYERQIDALASSSRYQLGDALIDLARRRKSVWSTFGRLRELYEHRTRKIPRAAAITAVERPNSSLKIGAVLDEFSWSCFASEAELVELRPDTAAKEVEAGIDLVLVESAWRGNRGQWSYHINGAASLEPLGSLVDACAANGVPAVFWNKEDPVGYEAFLDAARLFPVVLTTDVDSVSNYRRDTPARISGSLAFAAQPRRHNPIGRPIDPLRRVCFAGAWRGDKYPDRARQIDELMGPAHELGVLDIFDRYANHPDRALLGFPAPYSNDVLGSLSYDETISAYRRYAAFLNVNSVTDSPTMFSRRVFEILACGTPVISTPSLGIDELLGDVVISVASPVDSRRAVEELIADRRSRDRRGHLGYRLVHSAHTYGHRLSEIAAYVGVSHPPVAEPSVAFTCVTNRPHLLDRVVSTFHAQSYSNKHLVIVCNADDFDVSVVRARVADVAGAIVLSLPADKTLGDCLNAAVQATPADYLAKIDDDDDYGQNYLTDMMLTFGYSGTKIVGKRTYYAYLEKSERSTLRFPGQEFVDVDEVAGGTLVFTRQLALDVPFRQLPQGTDTAFLRDVAASGERIFSGDRYNFVQHRRADLSDHTWRIDDQEFERVAEVVGSGYSRDEFFL